MKDATNKQTKNQTTKGNKMETIFGEMEVISTYTRAQAIEDGMLHDVSEMAREAGFVFPVAVTAAVLSLVNNIPPSLQGIADYQGRMWDVLYVAKCRARQGGRQINYVITMPHGRKKNVYLKAVIGPGDTAAPVITIMLQDED